MRDTTAFSACRPRATAAATAGLIILLAADLCLGSGPARAESRDLTPLSETETRPEIPYDPFPMVDPVTGGVVTADSEIQVRNPDGTAGPMRAGDYYTQLNDLQRRMNRAGYSLKDPETVRQLGRIPVNGPLLDRQFDATVASLAVFDDKVMALVRDPKALSAALTSLAEDTGNRLLARLYAEARAGGGDAPVIALRPLDPDVVRRPSADLNNVLLKTWSFQEGELDKLAVKGQFDLNLTGSTKAAEAVANASLDVYFFDPAGINVAHASARGRAGTEAALAWDLFLCGREVYKQEVEFGADAGPQQRNGKASGQALPTLDVKQDYFFMIGPIPVTATLGVVGGINYDYTVGIDGGRAAGAAWLEGGIKGYAQVVINAAVARGGVGGDLTVLANVVKLEGTVGPEVDPGSGEQRVVAAVRGTNRMTLLKGELYAFAEGYVPVPALPPWEKKTWRKSLFEYPGLETGGETELFNFSKSVGANGFYLSGAPRQEDYEEVDVEQALLTALADGVAEVMSPETERVLMEGGATIAVLAELTRGLAAAESRLSPD